MNYHYLVSVIVVCVTRDVCSPAEQHVCEPSEADEQDTIQFIERTGWIVYHLYNAYNECL